MPVEISDASPAVTGGGGVLSREHAELLSLTEEEQPEKNETAVKSPDIHRTAASAPQDSSPSLSGLPERRSRSDAYMHAVSRSRAVDAAAAAKRVKGHLHGADHGQQHDHQPFLLPHLLHGHHKHHSHGSIAAGEKGGSEWSVYRKTKPQTRRAHSQSSLARLTIGQVHTDHHTKHSTSSLSPSRRATRPEQEVTYVWRDGRVQVHSPQAASDDANKYFEHRTSSGQHVEYLWQCGNVQKVIRGSNNEMLATEAVRPRGPVKGVNYCVVFCVLVFFIVTIISLVFVLKVFG